MIFLAIPVYCSEQAVRVAITEIARYSVYDRYMAGDGTLVILKDGSTIHTGWTCEQMDEALRDG